MRAGGGPRASTSALRRDWAAEAGGAAVLRNPALYDDTGAPFGCGLAQLIDQCRWASGGRPFQPGQPGSGEPADRPADRRRGGCLQTIDVTAFGLDPFEHVRRGDPSATTKDYRLETSRDGQNVPRSPSRARSTMADRGRLNLVEARRQRRGRAATCG